MEKDRLKDLGIGQRVLLKCIIKKCNGDAWARLLWLIYLNINQLDALNFMSLFHASMFRAHVLIVRRSKLYYTASDIITPIDVMIPEAV